MDIKVSNYEIQSEKAKKELLKFDYEEIVEKLDLKHDDEYLYLKFIDGEYRLGKKTAEFERLEGENTYKNAGFNEVMSILDLFAYLSKLSKDQLKATKNFVAPTGLKGVVNTGNIQTHSWVFSKHAKAFSGKTDKLEEACKKMGGTKINQGDVGYIIDIFDYIQVMFVYYEEDSDFEAEIKVLWTDNVLDFVHYETTYYMLGRLFERMAELIEE